MWCQLLRIKSLNANQYLHTNFRNKKVPCSIEQQTLFSVPSAHDFHWLWWFQESQRLVRWRSHLWLERLCVSLPCRYLGFPLTLHSKPFFVCPGSLCNSQVESTVDAGRVWRWETDEDGLGGEVVSETWQPFFLAVLAFKDWRWCPCVVTQNWLGGIEMSHLERVLGCY